MFLTDRDIAELVAWRRKLHRMPELSGEEEKTAREVCAFLSSTHADRILSNLGGHGVAAVYEGAAPGPTILFRAELDALPIEEISDLAHRAATPGKAHLCGHDGHMASLAALALGLGRQRPQRGRAVLMFQPAEENGSGAAAVVDDPRFHEIQPDFAFSYHNMPGIALGQVALAAGPVNCASRGMRIVLSGKTAHASAPEYGVSPMTAVASLMPALAALGGDGRVDEGFAMVTVIHAKLGEPSFGVSPGHVEIWSTLRTLTNARMKRLGAAAEGLARCAAADAGLGVEVSPMAMFSTTARAPRGGRSSAPSSRRRSSAL